MSEKLDKYLNSAPNIASFRDKAMRKAVSDFIKACYEPTFDTRPYQATTCVSDLAVLLKDRQLDSITDYIFTGADSWDSSPKRKSFLKLILYLCNHDIITDNRIRRIKDFDNYINTGTVVQGFFVYVLNDVHYDEFIQSPLYKERDDYRAHEAYWLSLIDEPYKSPVIYETLCNNLKAVKFGSDYAVSSLIGVLLSLRHVAHEISGLTPEDLTSAKLLDFFKSYEAFSLYRRSTYQRAMLDTFIALYNADLLVEDNIRRFIKLITNNIHAMTFDSMREILASDDISNWEDCWFSRIDGTQHFYRYVNCSNKEKRELLLKFIHGSQLRDWQEVGTFCRYFEDSLEDINAPLSFDTFLHQVRHYSTYGQPHIFGIITTFYHYVMQNYTPDMFGDNHFVLAAFNRVHIAYEIADGYEVIVYNRLESVPECDKWLLCYTESVHDTVIKTKLIDFSRFECDTHRKWLKDYVWNASPMIETKAHPLSVMGPIFSYLYDLKTGKQLSILAEQNKDMSSFTAKEAEAIKNYILLNWGNNRTQLGKLYNFRNVIRHVDDNKLGQIESGVYHNLTLTLSNDYDNKQAVPNDELNAVSQVMRAKAEGTTVGAIYYSIFYIALETEFRGSRIVDLTTDCIRETAKNNEYVLVSMTKRTAGEITEQPITTYVKREIDEIIKLTEDYRQKCLDTRLKGLLFIVPGIRKGTYKKVTETKFNLYFQQCCAEAGIPSYSLENLRDTHMTKAEEFIIRNAMSEIEQSVLTGHSTITTDTIHYADTNIRTLLEAVHGITIGNVSIDGKIVNSLDPSIATNENEVSNGCGYCTCTCCKDYSYLDCLVCPDFVTTVSRLPYFKERLEMIDRQIYSSKIPHDKEDLVNIKRLLLHYIEEILKRKEAAENGIN